MAFFYSQKIVTTFPAYTTLTNVGGRFKFGARYSMEASQHARLPPALREKVGSIRLSPKEISAAAKKYPVKNPLQARDLAAADKLGARKYLSMDPMGNTKYFKGATYPIKDEVTNRTLNFSLKKRRIAEGKYRNFLG